MLEGMDYRSIIDNRNEDGTSFRAIVYHSNGNNALVHISKFKGFTVTMDQDGSLMISTDNGYSGMLDLFEKVAQALSETNKEE